MKIEKEVWDVAGWHVDVIYNPRQVSITIDDCKFWLNYEKEEGECQIKEFIDFLYITLGRFQGQDPLIERDIRELKCELK